MVSKSYSPNWLFLLFLSHLIAGAGQVNVVWQLDRLQAWEDDWITSLLDGLKIEIIDDGKFQVQKNNAIIVVSADQEKRLVGYMQRLKERGYKFGIIILNDENYISSTDYYHYPLFIFKNYWHKKYDSFDHVHCFMLGYKSGFNRVKTQAIKPVDQRAYDWSFAGQIVRKFTDEEKKNKYHNSRIEMIRYMREIDNFFLHGIYGWNSAKSLPVAEYKDIMLNSIFVPCPRGHWNLDSYRLSEALECGCIPIVETEPIDYFHKFLGQHPFICVSDWSQAVTQVNALLENCQALQERANACHEWWKDYKKKTNTLFVTTIKNAFGFKTSPKSVQKNDRCH